jgi:hypothetical protein
VSAKLTPEICINNASSNSRLTAAGRQATATDSHSQTCLQALFFFSLPTFDEKATELHLHAEKLTETVLHLNLGHLVGFFFLFVQFCSTLCLSFYETTTEQHLRHHLQDWRLRDDTKIIKTEISLHLNLEVFIFYFLFCFIKFYYIYIFLSFIYFFIFILIFTLFIFYFQSSLCLSNAFSAYG